MRICVPYSNEKMFCFVVPPIDVIRMHVHPGDLVKKPADPSPWRQWAGIESMPEQAQSELSTIAAIDQLADGLQPGVRETVRNAVRTVATNYRDLPKGATISF